MVICVFFFFNDTATTEIYTLSLHDALPISDATSEAAARRGVAEGRSDGGDDRRRRERRSEEHTSELQSQSNLVCRLLLEKKKTEPEHTTALAPPADVPAQPHYRQSRVSACP